MTNRMDVSFAVLEPRSTRQVIIAVFVTQASTMMGLNQIVSHVMIALSESMMRRQLVNHVQKEASPMRTKQSACKLSCGFWPCSMGGVVM